MSNYTDLMDAFAKESQVFNDNPDAIAHIDERQFRFGLMLMNQDGYIFRVRKDAITELKLVDSLTEWFHYGYVDISNPDDMMERASLSRDADWTEKQSNPYSFRSDSRDLLYFFMEPYLGTDGAVTPVLENEVYTIKMLFTIYKTDDLNDQYKKSRGKAQRLYFHDYRYQSLIEKNLYYSTAKHNQPSLNISSAPKTKSRKPITQHGNANRSKLTGEIIQDIFRSTFGRSDLVKCFEFRWSFGAAEMMYTSPSNYRALDDLNYILSRHTDFSGDPCLLKLNRYSNMWSLAPLTQYFLNSTTDEMTPGPIQSENFTLSFGGSVEESGKIPSSRKSFPAGVSNPMVNYHLEDISIIEDFTFVEMDGTDCQLELDSTVVTRYSDKDKQYSLDLTANNIGDIRDHFANLYAGPMLSTNGIGAHPAWLDDTSRTGYFNFSVVDSWSPDEAASMSVSHSKKLLASVMLGNSIYFNVRGMTARRSGVFMTMDREYEYTDNVYDNKVLGQYLITRVEHIITSGEYTNHIIGVKPTLFSNQNQDTSDIFLRNTNELINE